MARFLRNIVYVDDVYHSLISIKERLKNRYTVYPAQSAEILFDLLEYVEPELFLIDINMPDMNGFEIIQRLKDDCDYSSIPIIVITGTRHRNNVIRGFDVGADDIVFKPITDAQLIERIEYNINPSDRESELPIILAVDDSPVVLQKIYHALKDEYTVYTLPKPETIKETLKLITPDLFLLDCHMPIINGFELLTMLRSFVEHEETPALYLTSDGTKDTVFAAMGVGANDFIVKPVDNEVLRLKVAQHLVDYRKLRALRKFDIEANS